MTGEGTAPSASRCAAMITNDLLDCDCGQITRQMKIRILTERDQHTAAAHRAEPESE